jgi:hypothetical protein
MLKVECLGCQYKNVNKLFATDVAGRSRVPKNLN